MKPTIYSLLLLGGAGAVVALAGATQLHLVPVVQAQESSIQQQEEQLIREFELPSASPPAPVYRPAPPAPAYRPPAPAPAPRPAYSSPPEPSEREAPPQVEPASEAAQTLPGAIEAAEPATESATESAGGATSPASSGPLSRYVLEFNRSPIVGNRLQMRGVFAERRLGFTRPRGWDVKTAKVLVRYQHSPALLAERSNLLLRVNGTSVGSVPLNQKNAEIGEVLVEIPPNLIQDYTEITLVAQQNNDKTCSNPADPSLWTEVLPDSKVILDYLPQGIDLDFANFPYPFFDPLALDANRIAYVLPERTDETWLTAAARFQASMGRRADYRPLETNLVQDASQLAWNDRLVVIGTPENQPLLAELQLPGQLSQNRWVDDNQQPLPEDVAVLLLTTAPEGGNPILVISGNGPEAIDRGIQSLQSGSSEALGSGQLIYVTDSTTPPTPELRRWPGHLPPQERFSLRDLQQVRGKTFQDTTVRASSAPPIEIDFRALGDDYFLRGNAMKLVYSYGPQLDPRSSTVEVAIDDVTVAGQRLGSKGATKESFNVNLPENLIKPDSKLRVSFQLNPREGEECGIANDSNLWATLHGETGFDLNRETSVDLPNLKLTQVGFPYAEPQDLSNTTFVTGDNPSAATLRTLLEVSERFGRLSQSPTVQLTAYPVSELPSEARSEDNLVLVGSRDQFPLMAELKQESRDRNGLLLTGQSLKDKDGTVIQTFPEGKGIIQQMISPWNPERVILALAGQSDRDLGLVEQMFEYDNWFLQLEGDTVLVSRNDETVSPFDPNAFNLESLQANRVRRFEKVGPLSKVSRFLQERWLMLPLAILTLCIVMYGISQIYLKRVGGAK